MRTIVNGQVDSATPTQTFEQDNRPCRAWEIVTRAERTSARFSPGLDSAAYSAGAARARPCAKLASRLVFPAARGPDAWAVGK